LVGKCGATFAHCSSSNQNKSALIGLAAKSVDQTSASEHD